MKKYIIKRLADERFYRCSLSQPFGDKLEIWVDEGAKIFRKDSPEVIKAKQRPEEYKLIRVFKPKSKKTK